MRVSELDFLREGRVQTRPAVFSKRKIPRGELAAFSYTLSQLLAGGVPMMKALRILEGALSKAALRPVLQSVQEEVCNGKSLSDALRKHESRLPEYFVSMVEAGESSGKLDSILDSLASYLNQEENNARAVRQAMAYPAFVLVLGAATLVILLQFVMPRLAAMYGDFGGKLPWLTSAVFSASRMFLPFLAVSAAALAGAFIFLKRSNFRFLPHLMKVPGIRDLRAARFSAIFSLLMQSGIPVLEALRSSFEAFPCGGNEREVRARIEKGEGLSLSMARLGIYSEVSLALLATGEESGTLPQMLSRIAGDLDRKSADAVTVFFKILEPALILFVGVTTGLIVVSALLPILEMPDLIH